MGQHIPGAPAPEKKEQRASSFPSLVAPPQYGSVQERIRTKVMSLRYTTFRVKRGVNRPVISLTACSMTGIDVDRTVVNGSPSMGAQ